MFDSEKAPRGVAVEPNTRFCGEPELVLLVALDPFAVSLTVELPLSIIPLAAVWAFGSVTGFACKNKLWWMLAPYIRNICPLKPNNFLTFPSRDGFRPCSRLSQILEADLHSRPHEP